MDVKCQDIHYSIGEKKILNGVSLEVEGGQFQIAVRFFLMGNP